MVIVSIISLVIALISLFFSIKNQNLQNKINELELVIKKDEAERLRKEKEKENESTVEARVVSFGRDDYRMKVWNSGKASAYNVSANFEGNANIIIADTEKMPFEVLEPSKSFELRLIVHMGSAHAFKIRTQWTDEHGKEQYKIQMGDI